MASIQFKGKSSVQTLHLSVPYQQLVPQADLSQTATPGLGDNLIVYGDNLLALKALLPTYGGKVKCIYIDPPYNTGNEGWVYNDNVNSPMHRDWLHKAVDRDDLTRHDKWLCMIYPRLKLLRDLLRDDGAIFVSIDDNEAHRLRMLMDEIFGEENFVATVVWQKKYSPQNDAQFLSAMHDYIVIYAKNIEVWQRNLLPRSEKQDKAYKNTDSDPRGPWKPSDLTRAEHRDRDYYAITTPSGKKVYPAKGRSWSRPPDEIERLRQDNRLFFGVNGDAIPSLKRFLDEVKQGVVPVTLWTYDEVGSTDDARKELKDVFDGEVPLETIKPSSLIKRILQLATDADSIVLDSFAGSGTTAQAVLALNAEDGGSRRFILVEQEGYASSLTAERVRRVMAGVRAAKDEALRNGYGGSFSYFTLGPAIDEGVLLSGEALPAYRDLARYVFFTATGEQLDESQIDEARWFVGASRTHDVYMIYQPSVDFLKRTPLGFDWAQALSQSARPRLVIASFKLVDDDVLRDLDIEFCQLPFEIYRYRA